MKDIIIITAFGGRRFCFDKFIAGLLALDYPKDKITWVVSDGSGESLEAELREIGKSYKAFYYFKDNRKPMAGVTAGEVEKSKRIASVYQNMANIVKDIQADYVLSIEDDIVAPPDGLKKLLEIMEYKKVGCAFGRQICRWMELPLVWRIKHKKVFGEKDVCQETKANCEILKVKDEGIEEVDGMPMGFNVIRKDLFDKEVFRAVAYGMWGFDLIFAQDLKKWGYKVIIDWSVQCRHYHNSEIKSEFGSYNIIKELY